MAQNSKDVLFKSKVNNYISEKLSQSGTPPVFSVTDVGEGSYKLSSFNGNVRLTIVGEEYVFTPLRGTPVSVPISSVTNIVVDFITLSADSSILGGVSITGSGIVNIDQHTIMSETVLSGVQPAVVSVNVVSEAQQTPPELSTFEIASPTVGRIINIIEGEVVLSSSLSIPTDTSIVVDTGATLTLTQAQNANGAVSGQGNINVLTESTPPAITNPSTFTFSDTGASSTDGITSDGTITIALAENTLSWQYTLDGGTTWNPGTGSSFEIPEGSYDKQNIQVKQFDGANFTGNASISPMSTLTTPSMVKLEAIDRTDGNDYSPQITSIGTAGEYVVTFYGANSEEDSSIFVQKFNADGTVAGEMVQLAAIDMTNSYDRHPQITSIGTAGEYVVTFQGGFVNNSAFVQKFNADGTITDNTMVQLEAIGAAWFPQITSIGTAGEYAVTFTGTDSDEGWSIFVQKFNADGTITDNVMAQLKAIDVTSTNSKASFSQIASIGTTGEFAVTFFGIDSNEHESIFVQKFNADGVVEGEMVQLKASGAVGQHPQITSIGTAGEYVVTFQGHDSEGDYSIFVQKFNENGAVEGDMVKLEAIGVTDGEDINPQITSIGTAGEYVVTFQGHDSEVDYSIFVQKFNENGAVEGDMVHLDVVGVPFSGDGNPQITSIGNTEEFVVTFYGREINGDRSIFVQKFNADGVVEGDMVKLAPTGVTDISSIKPQITSIGTAGDFAVTFTGLDSDGDYSIFVQKFNADGTIAAHPQNTLKVDTTPPTIALTNPITITDTKILISFSEPIDASALTLDDILLSNSHTFGEGAVLSPSSGFAATLEITLGTNPTIASGDTLTIAPSKLVDKAGNANAAEIVYALPTFEVINTGGAITFGGTATGMISLSVDGNDMVTFTKGSIAAATTVELGSITGIVIDSGETIKGSAADLHNISITGAGNVVITGSDSVDNLLVSTSGTNSITAGSGADTINLGTVAANEGDDTIIIVAEDSTTVAPDTINYFELDKDKLKLPSMIVAQNPGPQLVQTEENLNLIITELEETIADGETVAFAYDIDNISGTYIFQGNAEADILVNLVGVATVDDLSAILA